MAVLGTGVPADGEGLDPGPLEPERELSWLLQLGPQERRLSLIVL